jgi:Zn-dependent M32 family carboxypeptidase
MSARLDELKDRLLEVNDLGSAAAVLRWDQATYMPSGGAEARARLMLMTSNGLEADGKIADALRTCELALAVDPLNLELHHKRHALLKRTPVAR